MVIVVVGGGWAGAAAAYAANSAGAEVILLERTDMLLGTGLVGGIMRNNGRFTAIEEVWAMGGGNFLKLIEEAVTHRCLDFPGHRHATLYDVNGIEPSVREALSTAGVRLKLQSRVIDVIKEDGYITGVCTADNEVLQGDVFIDCTGTAGPLENCTRYGSGCVRCVLRCPTFGPRVSLTDRAGIAEIRAGEGFPQYEAMSGSCKLEKKSLEPNLKEKIEKEGVLVIPLPKHLHNGDKLSRKVCQQYSSIEFAENLVLLDTGDVKLMTPFFPLEILRNMDGFKQASYADPFSGGKGNSVRFMAMAPCEETMLVRGTDNLFCAGEKTGPLVGHTEAIVTGFLAGQNAVRRCSGKELLVFPQELACGDIISFMLRSIKNHEGRGRKYTFSGSPYFERMRELGLYTTDVAAIKRRVKRAGLDGAFKHRLI